MHLCNRKSTVIGYFSLKEQRKRSRVEINELVLWLIR